MIADLDRLAALAQNQPSGFGGALGDDPGFGRGLARLRLEAEALEMTELRILADLAQGRAPGPQTSLVKLVASTLRQRVDEMTVESFGLDALQLATQRPLYGNESPEPIGSKPAQLAMPTYLNSRAWTIFGGSNEVQKNIIAKTVLGL